MIKLKDLLNEAPPGMTAINVKTGRRTPFGSTASYAAAIKAGTHKPLQAPASQNIQGGAAKATPSNHNDSSYWKDKKGNGKDSDWGDSEYGPQLTSDSLDKIQTALENELKLKDNGFTIARVCGGGAGDIEGPMTIIPKDAEDEYTALSIGSGENDGKFSISFTNQDGEPLYNDKDYGSLTGKTTLTPKQSYDMAKVLMAMPEVQKFIKGEMSVGEFKSIHDKIVSSFNKK